MKLGRQEVGTLLPEIEERLKLKDMTRVKRTAQETLKIAKSTSHPNLTMIPIPENPLEEGGVLYRQYFCRFGMTPELREYIMMTKKWTPEHITMHVKYLAKIWETEKERICKA